MPTMSSPTGAVIIGSFPAPTGKEAMSRLSTALPDRFRSIPDGEVGHRINWLVWQMHCFPRGAIREFWNGRFGFVSEPASAPGTSYTLDSIKPTGYDDVAIDSYADFKALQTSGIIPSQVKFQVCLPTAFNVMTALVRSELHHTLEPLYEQRLGQSIERIYASIPHDKLVLQLDLAWETILLEDSQGRNEVDKMWEAHFTPVREGFLERIQRFARYVPEGCPLSIHICFGDYGHRHFIEPRDLGVVVQFANEIIELVGPRNPISYVHLPVPRDRVDAPFYAPLESLRMKSGKLYLGLIHAQDLEGTKRRVEQAKAAYSGDFGVATECGLGRTTSEDIDSVLKIIQEVTGKEQYI